MIPKKLKNHKVLVGPPCRREKDSHGYYSSGDFRVWHVLCDPFILRDDTMEETDEFVMGWEFEDDPVMPELDEDEYDEDDATVDDISLSFRFLPVKVLPF